VSGGNWMLRDNIYDIKDTLMFRQKDDEDEMTQYIGDSESLKAKLESVYWDVEMVNNVVYGCIRVKLNEPLTAEEKTELTEEILGQNSDGFGESFEQHPVQTSRDGDLYISFWHSGNDYFLLDDDEFKQRLSGKQANAPTAEEKQLPKCPIIGADGNIYSLMGIASRTLKDNGLRDEAKEMGERVRASGSYDAALVVIMEYVEPVSVNEPDEDYDEDYGEDYDEDEEEDYGMGGIS
jgi:hypothetical protein